MIRRTFHLSKALRLIGISAAAAAFGAVGWLALGHAQEASSLGGAYPGYPSPEQLNQKLVEGDGEVHVLTVRPGRIYMLWGAGGNITVQIGDNGILMVNTGKAEMSDKVLAAIHSLAHQSAKMPLRTIINTDVDADDAGGNLAIAKTGLTVNGGNVVGNIGASAEDTATIIGTQQILDRMSTAGSKDMQPDGAWPTDTYALPKKDIWFNNESIRIYHVPNAHTDGDSMVYFRLSDVVSAGNIFSTASYPVIDLARGGNIQGIIAGLNRLIYQITITGEQNGGGTLVIPNQGRISNQADVVYYQEMAVIVRDRIQNYINKGMTLEQIEAAKPTIDYDPRYAAATGPHSADAFIEAVYKSLTIKPKMKETETGE